MSGHSKWATIKRQKGVNDMKRALVFTKLSNAISVAVRQGGNIADPESNFKLRLAIEAARAENMPKDNIERAISRAAGKQGASLEEVTYEGFGPGGFSVVVEAYTDNKQRTVAEVKNLFDKNGGTLGAQGSVMYQFERKGVIGVEKDKSFDEVLMLAADGGAEDAEESEDNKILIFTKPDELAKVRTFLEDNSFKISSSELIYKPTTFFDISKIDMRDKAVEFLERIEDQNDVHMVYDNIDFIGEAREL